MENSKKKILVIDDEKDVRNTIVDLLTNFGYATISAEDGLQAISVLENEIPDLVISDIMMPGMSGYQVLEHFQKIPAASTVPFIFLTAKVDCNDLRKGMNIGADDYLTKPVRAKELLQSIETRLKKKERTETKYDEIFMDISTHLPHELRPPLIPIFGFTDMIRESLKDLTEDEIFEMLDKIKYSTQRLHRTIEKFIRYAESRLRIAEKPNITDAGKSISTETTIKIAAKNTALKQKRHDDLIMNISEASIKIADTDMEFIVEEMIENAVKFSNPGTKIIVSGAVKELVYVLKVTDLGRGMTAGQLSKINAFVQHDRNIYQQNGIGLGLITIRKLTEYYGGSLKIVSSPNRFTSCCVELPVECKTEKLSKNIRIDKNAVKNYSCS